MSNINHDQLDKFLSGINKMYSEANEKQLKLIRSYIANEVSFDTYKVQDAEYTTIKKTITDISDLYFMVLRGQTTDFSSGEELKEKAKNYLHEKEENNEKD